MSVTDRQRIEILHVDDEPGFADLTETFLEREDDRITVESVTDGAEGLQYLTDSSPDCIVSDYNMPDTDGLEFLETVRETHPDLPFILFTGKGSEAVASDAISAGVTDYLQKGSGSEQYKLLANRVKNAVQARREAQRAERQEQLMRLTEFAGDIGGWELDVGTDEVIITSGGQRLLGVENERMPFERLLEFCPSDHEERLRAAVDTVIETQEQVERTCEVRATDDTWRQVEITMTPVLTGGDVTKIRGAINDITQHKRRARRLSQYKHLLENINDAVFMIDSDWRIVYANEQSLSNIDITAQEANGEPIIPFVEQYAADQSSVAEFERALAATMDDSVTRAPDSVELTVVADGSESTYEHQFSRVSMGTADSRERVDEAVAVVAREITERKERERELRQTQDIMSDMEQLADVGAWEYDPDTDTLVMTDGAHRIYGLEPDTDLSLSEAFDFVHPEDRDPLTERFTECIETGEPYRMDVRTIRNDGERLWTTVQGKCIRQQDTEVIRGYIQDITEKQKRITKLEEAEMLFRNAQDMLFIIEHSGEEFVVQRVNDAFESATGLTNEELQGRTPRELFGEERGREIEAKYTQCIESGESLSYEETLAEDQVPNKESPTDDGSVYWKTHITPVETDGDADLIVGATRDINDQKRREQRLKRRNDRLDEFTSIISHDLRNPLSVVNGKLQLAREDCDSDHLADAANAVSRCQALLEDTLTLAQQGEQIGETSSVALSDVAEQSWQTVVTGSAELKIETERTVQGDETSLQQLFENLFRNAVEHGGDDVTISVGETDDGFFVADTGPGFLESDPERIFEPGYSTKDDGTGFGLRIVKEIVDAHNWEINATETPQSGARFEVANVDP